MSYKIVKTKRFKTAYKRVRRLSGFKEEVFKAIVSNLALGRVLDTKYKDHKLTGNLRDFRECHLASDILLIYQIDDGILVLTLVGVGSHSQLFN